ncbi:MAG: DUF4365 domain-containing protein [Spirochaetales bacterium]|nr:DUF4365 domain-containing protein [Spirochaetales bacterium]
MASKPTISREHIVDQKARKYFESCLPDDWPVRKQDPDYHVDYVVEIGTGGEPSGLRFDVQLKGKERPRTRHSYLECRMKVKHLAYYLDRVLEPVFLVLVDVTDRKGYWLFLQRWLRDECPDRNWRGQNSVPVRIPLTQALEDSDRLRLAVEDAIRCMREMRPGSPEAALRAETARLESLDPRVKVEMAVGPAGREITVTPLETIRGTIEVAGLSAPEFSQRMGALVRTGQTAYFKRGEITVAGFPLLDTALKGEHDWELTMESTRRLKAELSLSSEDPEGRRRRHGVASGELALGAAGCHFEGQLADSPIWLSFAMTPEDLSRNCWNVTVETRADEWEGRRLSALPGIDIVEGLSRATVDAEGFLIEFFAAGRHVFTASATVEQVASLFAPGALDFVLRSRRAAQYLGLDPVLPPADGITQDDIWSIALFDELARQGEHRQPGCGVSVALPVRPFLDWEEAPGLQCRGLDVIFQGAGLPGLRLFDQDVSKTTFDFRLSSAALSYDSDELKSARRTDPPGFVHTVWEGQPGSAFMIRRSLLKWEEEPHVLIGMPRSVEPGSPEQGNRPP